MAVAIIVGKVTGKQRPRFSRGIVYTPKQTQQAERLIKSEYVKQCNEFFEGYIKIKIEIFKEIPKSYSKKQVKAIEAGTLLPDKKPDNDNVEKLVFDALEGTAYENDKQIIENTTIKRYAKLGEKEYLKINIEKVL